MMSMVLPWLISSYQYDERRTGLALARLYMLTLTHQWTGAMPFAGGAPLPQLCQEDSKNVTMEIKEQNNCLILHLKWAFFLL